MTSTERLQRAAERRDLTQGPITKKILLFSLPIIFGNLFQQLYNVVDSVVVGNFAADGTHCLAAVNASFAIMMVFNAFTSTPVLYYDHGKAWVWTPDDEEVDSTTFSRYYAGFLASHNISELQFIVGDSVQCLDGALFKPPHVHLMGRRLLAMGAGRWRHMTSPQPLQLNQIIVTNRFHGTAAKLRELYRFDTLIISGAMHSTSLKPLLHACDSLDIPYHDLSQQGAFIVTE